MNTTFNYPTMAEAYRVAAYDGLNRLLSGSGRWPEPAGETDFSNSREWQWPNRESL